MQGRWVALGVAQLLLAGVASAAEPSDAGVPQGATPAPAADVTEALYAILPLPLHIGDPWQASLSRLWGMRCLPEDSALFSAMDCRSDLALGPFSAQGPEGDGLSLISDDDAALSRVKSTRLTPWTHIDCERFQAAVQQALTQARVPSTIERSRGATRVRAGNPGDIQLSVECRPGSQTFELADGWVHLVPSGDCPNLAAAPAELRALADSAMTGTVHDDFEELGTACNRAGYQVSEYAGQLMNGLMAAYTVLGQTIPTSAPVWLLSQIRAGLANARRDGASLRPDARRRFEAFLDREVSPARLTSLWSAVRKNRNTVRQDQPSERSERPSRSRH